jgi:hypothetical protein
MDLGSEIQAELEKASRARHRGNEGMARVCARRAAGIAVKVYLARRGVLVKSASSIELLHRLQNDPILSPELKTLIDHLTLRVDEEFKLPPDVDVLADAGRLCELLTRA